MNIEYLLWNNTYIILNFQRFLVDVEVGENSTQGLLVKDYTDTDIVEQRLIGILLFFSHICAVNIVAVGTERNAHKTNIF